MSIERRYNHRLPIQLGSNICFHERCYFGTIRNICNYGMFIETSQLCLPSGNLVDLEFVFNKHHWSIPALVIHCNDQGFGVLFKSPQPELIRMIEQYGGPITLNTLPLRPISEATLSRY